MQEVVRVWFGRDLVIRGPSWCETPDGNAASLGIPVTASCGVISVWKKE